MPTRPNPSERRFKHYAPAETEAKYYYHSTYGPPTPAQ
jgi:hypothetical protein